MSLIENRVLSLNQAQPGAGPAAPVLDVKHNPRPETYLNLDNNIRSKVDNNFVPIINAQDETAQQYVNTAYVNFTGREQISPTVVEQINVQREKDGTNWWRYKDTPRTTTNETTHYSYAGNAQRETDGSNWWRYKDTPRTTTNETTHYSYAGNAQRETDGSNWWRYKDTPRTTTNETTHYSYAGNAQRETDGTMNRQQFTGVSVELETPTNDGGSKCPVRLQTSGVTNWGQGGMTLIEDYVPGPNGVTNLQQDADEIIGWTQMQADWDAVNSKGPGTYDQMIPDATYFQQVSPDFIGEVQFNPNLEMGEDSRQTAIYQIENLKKNGLSIYQDPSLHNKSSCETIPTFFIDSTAQTYSGIARQPLKMEPLQQQNPDNMPNGLYNVFPNNRYNFNQVKVFNTLASPNDGKNENPFLFGQNKANNSATFQGKGYPNSALCGNLLNPPIALDINSLESSRYLNRLNPNNSSQLETNSCY